MKRPSSERLVMLDDPRSFQAEAYRVLRTNLHYANPDAPLRRLLITSAGPGEGKSTTVANLGISFAQSERVVLLVDTDLRRPTLHTMFRQPNSPGLSSYLAGDALLDAVIQKTAVPNLSIVGSGPTPPSAGPPVRSARTHQLPSGDRARSAAYTCIDTPPGCTMPFAGHKKLR